MSPGNATMCSGAFLSCKEIDMYESISRDGKVEKDGERALISALEKLGFYVKHIDCNIDGFPDLIVIGESVALVEMKYIEAGSNPKVREFMEPSQPVFLNSLSRAGFCESFLCIYDGKMFSVYSTEGLLSKCLDEGRLNEMLPLRRDLSARETAIVISDYMQKG